MQGILKIAKFGKVSEISRLAGQNYGSGVGVGRKRRRNKRRGGGEKARIIEPVENCFVIVEIFYFAF